jgi:hypothetical protein
MVIAIGLLSVLFIWMGSKTGTEDMNQLISTSRTKWEPIPLTFTDFEIYCI